MNSEHLAHNTALSFRVYYSGVYNYALPYYTDIRWLTRSARWKSSLVWSELVCSGLVWSYLVCTDDELMMHL